MNNEEIRNLIKAYGFCPHQCICFTPEDVYDIDGCEDFCLYINGKKGRTMIKIWEPEYSTNMKIGFTSVLLDCDIEEISSSEVEKIFQNIIKKYYEMKKEIRKQNLEKYLDEE